MNDIAADRFGVANFFCLKDKFLTWNLVSRNLKLKHRRSYLGFLWVIMDPALNALVFYFVFQIIARLAIPNYLLHLMAGLIPWTFFTQTLGGGMVIIVGSRSLITKTPVNLHVFPMSVTITNLVNFIFSLPVLLVLPFVYGQPLGWSLLALIPLIGLLAVFTHCLSIILAIVYVYFRDFKNVLNVVLKLWFYATPILYQVTMIPDNFKFLLYLNPMASFIICFNDIFYKASFDPEFFGIAAAWTAVTMGLSLVVAKMHFKHLVEYL